MGGISDEKECEQNTQCHTDFDGHAMIIFVEDGLKNTDEQHASKTKTNSACQADVPVYMTQMSTVIPPANAPFPFQPDA